MKNHSTVTQFIFTGLSDEPHLEALLFVLFLIIYILTIMGNLMMLLVIRTDSRLHTPMYFFLSNLSFLDLCFSTVTVPKLWSSSSGGGRPSSCCHIADEVPNVYIFRGLCKQARPERFNIDSDGLIDFLLCDESGKLRDGGRSAVTVPEHSPTHSDLSREPHTPTGQLVQEVRFHVLALMAENRDLVELMVSQGEHDQDGAVTSAPSSESHTSDCDLKHAEGIIKGELTLELEQQPTVTEEEIISTSFLQVLVEFRVSMPQQQLEVGKFGNHSMAIRMEVCRQALHDATKADKGMTLIVHDSENGDVIWGSTAKERNSGGKMLSHFMTLTRTTSRSSSSAPAACIPPPGGGPPDVAQSEDPKAVAILPPPCQDDDKALMFSYLMREQSSDYENQTTWLILVGFGELQHLGFLPFTLFLAIYLVTVGGNTLIVLAVASSQNLQTPMYFFLCHFSLLEIGYTSNIVPRLLWSFLEGKEAISLVSCLVQFYIFASLAAAECLLLSAMSYDRYLAICHPLHYPILMSTWLCGSLASGAWLSGFIFSAFTLALAAPLPLCPGIKEINHYFCDFAPVVGLFCGDVNIMWGAGVSISGFLTLAPFLLIVASYTLILRTVLRIPSSHGRQKAFSTCSSHLSVVGVFYGTLIVVYVAPTDHMPALLRKAFSVLYTVLTPMINPIIYSLKNQEVKWVLHKLWRQFISDCTPLRGTGRQLTSSWIPC
ncbi:PREDICTED: uncharacterized protein LOC102862420 [Elephantulus edwardii]|uniref:uncharacterized protein LOC102862420 n=1 Tax=Elephantulus edwardii TaxID=28737 RepID=UPI0003F09A77|nr:PREDICTED: uncharacterized protein LOC102862420 [Elephantulus edwardii]